MDSTNNALKRHFNFLSSNLDNVSLKEDWKWINNGTCLSNADRKSFPIIKNQEDGQFKDMIDSTNNYEDVIYANRDYKKADKIREIYCGHLMNHLKSCRNVMKKNNDRISDNGNKINGIRDQGFHRCRAMIILPTRNSALEVVKCLRTFMAKDHKVTKKYRKFILAFKENENQDDESDKSHESDDDSEEDFDEKDLANKKVMETIKNNIQLSKSKQTVKRRGIDFDEWIEGNTNERFLFGVGVDKKLFSVNVKLAKCDIIIGSPMGIKELLDEKQGYLNQLTVTSSIEMVIMDQTEYMLMQNFDNLNACFEKLNQTPRGGQECIKVMNSTLRIYEWALEHCGAKYRQNIIITAILHPFLKKIMSACHNFQGTSIFFPMPQFTTSDPLLMATRMAKEISAQPSSKKAKVSNDTIQFSRLLFSTPAPEECQDEEISSTTIVDMPSTDSRMSLFRRKVLPLLLNQVSGGGVLIYFAMTIDLYRVYDVMNTAKDSVACITEDKSEEEISPIVTLFAKGAIKFLLLSERFYALTRHRFSAAKHLVYYSTPSFPKFSRDFHEFLMHNSKATPSNPHRVINICEEELFDQVNSQLAFNVLYGQ